MASATSIVITEAEIRKTVEKAIPEVSCPVKNDAVKVRRVWLEKKINEYLDRVKTHYEQPSTTHY